MGLRQTTLVSLFALTLSLAQTARSQTSDRQIAKATTMPTEPILATQFPDPSAKRTPHPTMNPGEKLTLPIKELGNFDFDETIGGNIPPDVQRLDGVHFQTTGFMIPLNQAAEITQFALVPSLTICCLGSPPQIQHTIVVSTPRGIDFFPNPITVEGTLHVSEQKDGGFIVSIFQMDATSVRPFVEK
jgi:hypothetical protein